MSRFFGTKWPRILLAAALAVAAASFLPKIPRDQTIRVDLGDLASRVTELTIRWDSATDDELKDGIPRRSANIGDWTGEVTFRYQKNAAPRVVTEKMRAADGYYVVEIEIAGDEGRIVTKRIVELGGGSTTVDAADLHLRVSGSTDGGL